MRAASLALFVSLSSLTCAVCGCDTAPLPFVPDDVSDGGMFSRPPDLTLLPIDLPYFPRHDFGGGGLIGGVTGDPCQNSTECKPSLAPGQAKGTCTKSNMIGGNGSVTWPGGYCQASCRPARNDPAGINTTDCSGDTPVCAGAGGTGTCYAGCTSVNDCRDEYVCANITSTPTAACVPTLATDCDPVNDPRPSMKTCSPGSRCVSYSPDNSYGGCAEICDPVTQNCPPSMSGTNGCIADFQVNDGSGECISTNDANMEGAPCIYLNDCPAGMMCYGQKCRQYCRTGFKPCPQGQVCKDITLSGRQVKFKADTTGICTP